MSGLICFVVIVLFGKCAIGQINPDPDEIGIYFDRDATVVHREVGGIGERTVAYIAVTNAPALRAGGSVFAAVSFDWSGGGQIGLSGYGSMYEPFVDPSLRLWEGGTRPSAARTFEFPVGGGSESTTTVHILGWFEVLSYDRPVTAISIYIGSPEMDSSLAGPFFLPSNLTSLADIRPLHPSSGSLDLPVATINLQAPVRAESISLGALRVLFR